MYCWLLVVVVVYCLLFVVWCVLVLVCCLLLVLVVSIVGVVGVAIIGGLDFGVAVVLSGGPVFGVVGCGCVVGSVVGGGDCVLTRKKTKTPRKEEGYR